MFNSLEKVATIFLSLWGIVIIIGFIFNLGVTNYPIFDNPIFGLVSLFFLVVFIFSKIKKLLVKKDKELKSL